MKKIFLLIVVVVATLGFTTSCTKYNFADTGTSVGYHDCTMWDYFKQDSYNWDSLVIMAEHAGLQEIFMGTSSYGKNLTVFGMTNHSIRRYLLQNGYEQRTAVTSFFPPSSRAIKLSNSTTLHLALPQRIRVQSSDKVVRHTRCSLENSFGFTPIVNHTEVCRRLVLRKSILPPKLQEKPARLLPATL